MCSDETNEFPSNEYAEPTDEFATDVNDVAADIEAEPKPSWNRRKFLKAAALGAAAAALIGKDGTGRLRLGAASALAETLPNVNCTANDVRIIGPGIILNEPCNCSTTFNANIKFRINNNTGTQRYCVTVHLCAGRNAAGQIIVPAQDFNIPVIEPGEKDYTVTIPNYPCGTGLVCFGSAGSGADGGFAKGETCPPGTCCTVISWNVRANDPCPQPHNEIIKSKCRAQQVCIQGRGATLTCEDNCNPDCGGTVKFKLCGSGGTKPYTYSLSDGTTTYQPSSISGDCAIFNVVVTSSKTFVGTVTDNGNPKCSQQSNSVTVNAQPVNQPILNTTGPDCSGKVTINVTNCDQSLTYTFKEGTTTLASTGCSMTGTFTPGSHTVTVDVRNGAGTCTASATTTFVVNPAVTVVLGQPQSGCNGQVTLTATAGGGSGTFSSFTFSHSGTVTGTGATRTLTLPAQLDGQCRSVTVTVTDSAGCSATSTAQSFKQCVTTTACP